MDSRFKIQGCHRTLVTNLGSRVPPDGVGGEDSHLTYAGNECWYGHV